MVKRKTALTFYGGTNEIGGNKILLEDRDVKIFIDFGMSFASESQYFCGYLAPRQVNGAGDYLEFGLLPRIEGLYAKDMIKNTAIKYAEPSINAVILSHAHMDHVGYLSFVHEEIPVYCGECTKTILDAMQESCRINLGEHKFHTFRTGRKLGIDSVEVEPIHVDHSIPGAYGFIIHTSQGSIVYTGDLRLHGPMAHMTREFAAKASEANPALMISEGTRVSPEEKRPVHSEDDVKEKSDKVVAKASKLVVVAFYSRDIDRFKTFYQVTKNNDRKLVIPLKLAYLLSKLKDDAKLEIPDVMKDDSILFYKKRKRTGEFVESDYFQWERPFLEKAESFHYIQQNQSKVVFNLDLVAFTELIDVKPSRGGDFIYSMSEPFSEEDIASEVMHNWLEHFGLRFHQIHASGHCPPKDLATIVNTVKPKKLIPIHTEHPEMFKTLFKSIPSKIVKKEEQYLL